MLYLCRGEGLGEHISDHVVRGAVNKLDQPLLHDPVDPVVMHINVLCAWVVLIVACRCDGCLVVQKEGGGALDGAKDLRDEVAKPEGFLAAMCCCNILTFSGGQGDNLLPLQGPQYSAAVNEECIARDGAAVLSHAAICVCITFQGGIGLALCEPQVACARKIVEDPLHSLPIGRPRVCCKTGNCCNCKCNVWACCQYSPVEGTDCLMVGHIVHHPILPWACRCLV